MQSGLLFILSSLGFSVLFYSIYLFFQSEWVIGIILAIMSLLAIYFSMKLSENKTEEVLETKEENRDDSNFSLNEEPFVELEVQDSDEKPQLNEEVEETVDEILESPWEIHLPADKASNLLKPLIQSMISEKMFMENDQFHLSKDEIVDKYLIQEKIFQYQFHPVPLVAVVYNQDLDNFQIITGLTRDKMDYLTELPEKYKPSMQSIYPQLYDVKAYIEEGPYRIVDENLNDQTLTDEDFSLRLRFYFK